VLVVEATLHSGSLITARYAGDQGRDVFAIPGSIHSPLSKGLSQADPEGAKLVETAQDVLEELGSRRAGLQSHRRTHVRSAVLDGAGRDPADVDTLVTRTGLPRRGRRAADRARARRRVAPLPAADGSAPHDAVAIM
jgi:DNA processing protein